MAPMMARPYLRVEVDVAIFLSCVTDLRLARLRRDKWKSGDVARLVDAVSSNQGGAAGARWLWEKPVQGPKFEVDFDRSSENAT